MATVAEIEALLSARDKMSSVIKGAAGNTQKHTGAMSKAFKAVGSTIGAVVKGATVALGALGVGVIATARLAAIQETAEAKLATTLKSMSAETWTSVAALKAHASALQGTSKFGDEAIIEMQGLLLTFGQVTNQVGKGNDVFDRATTVVADLAEKMGTDLQPQAIMVGKALNDPVLGLTAMRRVGIQFTEQQEDQIKALVKSGETLEAQKIILGELERQFGGTAQAAADAGTGPFVQFKNIMGDIGEAIGRVTLPLLQDLAKWGSTKGQELAKWFDSDVGRLWAARLRFQIRGVVERLQEWGGWVLEKAPPVISKVKEFAGRFKEWFDSLGGLSGLLDKVKGSTGGLSSAFVILGGPMLLLAREILPRIAPAFDAIIPPLAELVNDLAPVFASLIVTLVDNLLPGLLVMIDGLIGFLAGNGGLVKALGLAAIAFKVITALMAVNPFILIATAVIAIAALIITNWDTIKGYLTRTWEQIKRGASNIWESIKGFFKGAVEFIKNLFLNFTPLGLFIKHMGTIREVAAGAANWVRDRFNALVDFFKGFGPAIGRAVGGVANLITSPFKAAFNAIAKLWNNTVGKLKFEIPSWVPGIGGNKFNVPPIPTFHDGGVFRAPPGQREGLAVLEDGETVTKAGGGGATEHHWHISQPMDAMAVFDFAAWKMRTAGT